MKKGTKKSDKDSKKSNSGKETRKEGKGHK
jgi:hypothetical protein